MKVLNQYQDIDGKPYPGGLAKGATGRVVIGKDDGAPFCMRVFEIKPGGHSAHHSHDFEHEVFVHSGKGLVISENGETPIGPGSVVFVPGGEIHQFKNAGDDNLVFVCAIPKGAPEL